MQTLVTGGAGFIGSNLVRALLEDDHDVRVLDDFSTGRKENLEGLQFDLIEGSIEDPSAAQSACEGVEVVFHQAALPSVKRSVEDPIRTHAVNANGTLNMLVAARDEGVRRVVYASSSSAYGDTPVLPKHEEMPTTPQSPYAVAKLAGEYYCRAFENVYELETVSLRYFNVFGPHQDPSSQYSAVIPLFINALLRGEPVTVYGDGEQTRDFTFIDNVVHANLAAADGGSESSGSVCNIACGGQVSLNELLRILADLMGVADPLIHYTDPRPGDIRDSLADIELARHVLDYRPKVALKEGLEKTIEWFSKHD